MMIFAYIFFRLLETEQSSYVLRNFFG